jgi:flavin-binding protein dodecin
MRKLCRGSARIAKVNRKPYRCVREAVMDEHIYRVIQLVGSSDQSIDDAIRRAVSRASKTLRNLRWFEVVETRGNIEDGKLSYQVTLKVGFTMEG